MKRRLPLSSLDVTNECEIPPDMPNPRQVIITRLADGADERLKVHVLVEGRAEVLSAGTGNDAGIADGQTDRRQHATLVWGRYQEHFSFSIIDPELVADHSGTQF